METLLVVSAMWAASVLFSIGLASAGDAVLRWAAKLTHAGARKQ